MSFGFVEIPGYPFYYICEEGLVYSAKRNRFLKWHQNSKDYIRVKVCNDGASQWLLVHRLVGILFVPNPDPLKKIEVNHNDFDKTNPAADNLTWMTPLENRKYNAKKSWRIPDENPEVYCPF